MCATIPIFHYSIPSFFHLSQPYQSLGQRKLQSEHFVFFHLSISPILFNSKTPKLTPQTAKVNKSKGMSVLVRRYFDV